MSIGLLFAYETLFTLLSLSSLEFFHSSSGVEHLFIACVERMTGATDFNADFLFC